MKPINNRCLVIPYREVSRNGIFIPETSESNKYPQYGTVKDIPEYYITRNNIKLPVPVKIGDNIVFNKERALPVRIGVEDFLFVNINDIGAVLWE